MVHGNYLRRFPALVATLALGLAGIQTSQAAEQPAVKPSEKRPETGAEKAAENVAKSKYLRVVHDAQERTIGLETAVVSFGPAAAPAADLQVDLVAAVHIADKKYYQELNKRFEGYDAVLYELVAPEGTRIPKGGRKDQGAGNMLSAVQLGMKDLLELEFQLDQVDYTRKNLIHADLSPDEFLKSMQDRKEGFTDIFARLLAYALAKEAQGGDGGDMQLLMALFDKDRSLALKRVMADQFQEMEGMTAVLDGPNGSTLIARRNERAMEVLKKQIAAGTKKIAIFYGAGHMADMEKRLRTDFALKPKETQWLRAWDMK
jgi:hypothetical protein